MRRGLFFALGIVACVVVAWGGVTLVKGLRGNVPGRPAAVATGTMKLGGAFALNDHLGRLVKDKDFLGRFMLIYFGYTFCPDICPAELQTMGRAMDALEKRVGKTRAETVVPVFITVDPARDTVAHLKDYVVAFHPRMVGLTGSAADIAGVAKAYKVYYRKSANPDAGKDDYLMDHTSFIYLMGPDGKFRALFRAGVEPGKLAGEIKAHLP